MLAVQQALLRAWTTRGPLACLLWPVSLVFGLLAALRRAGFRAGLLRSHRLPVPVVVVGNVVAGGSGKTPVVIALVRHLRTHGVAVGVVSRGHGRHTDDCREVLPDSLVSQVGDEPALIARAGGVPVFVARRRTEAAQALLAAHPRTQLIVCDDGLQHYALQRDIEICVFDERGTGNGWLLPAGPLREPWPRAADLVLHTADAPAFAGHRARRILAAHALRGDGTRQPLAALAGMPLRAVAGIARPEAFFAMLRAHGLTLADTVALPDHHDYNDGLELATDLPLICTEKDAVKLWRHWPEAWAVPLRVEFDSGFLDAFDRLVEAKLSSAHGPQTA